MPSAELQFLKYSFALGSIDEALKALEELKNLGDAADERGRPLWLSFFMSYSRPFGNNKGAGMFSSSVVPEEYKEIHDGIINGGVSTVDRVRRFSFFVPIQAEGSKICIR